MSRCAVLFALLWLAACGAPAADMTPPTAPPDPLRSGSSFLTPETLALQEDDFANPGYLWVDRGAALFQTGQIACASCHGTDLTTLDGAAATYPKWDPATARLLNLEHRINACRVDHQNKTPLAYESDELLALTAYVASLSRGAPIAVEVTAETAPDYARGEAYFHTRRGQFNLSCAQCHNENWGRQLRGDTISQGHGNGFPAYRLEWQSLGSLHRRLSDCDSGVRAAPHDLGSETYVALEYYLAVRASGLAMEAPGVRR